MPGFQQFSRRHIGAVMHIRNNAAHILIALLIFHQQDYIIVIGDKVHTGNGLNIKLPGKLHKTDKTPDAIHLCQRQMAHAVFFCLAEQASQGSSPPHFGKNRMGVKVGEHAL